MTREAEARVALLRWTADSLSAPYNATPFVRVVDAYRDAILATERERTAALVEAARRVYEWGTTDSIYEPEMGPDDKAEDMNGDGYFDALGSALRAYEEGVSE